MKPSTLYEKPPKPARWWILVTLAAGAAGAAAAISIAGSGTYDVGPFRMELRARPAALGKTQLSIADVAGVQPGRAEAGTHRGPIVFRAKIVGVRSSTSGVTAGGPGSPHEMATLVAEEGRDAMRALGIRLAVLALFGGLIGGALASMGRWPRIVGGALSGLLALAVVGVVVQGTYDKGEFLKTRFVSEQQQPAPLPTPT